MLAATPLDLLPGYRIEWGGDADERAETVQNLAASTGLIMVLTIATIVLTFNSFLLSIITGLVVILSMGLSLLALAIFQYPFGITALIGVIGSIGVPINAAIIILTALQQDPDAAAGDSLAMRHVVSTASRHIVSTTIATFGGFLPLILAGGGFWPPFAMSITGGVLLSTVVSLYFTPYCLRTHHALAPAGREPRSLGSTERSGLVFCSALRPYLDLSSNRNKTGASPVAKRAAAMSAGLASILGIFVGFGLFGTASGVLWLGLAILAALAVAGLFAAVTLLNRLRELALARESLSEQREALDLFAGAARTAKLGYFAWDLPADRCIRCSEEYAASHGVTVQQYLGVTSCVIVRSLFEELRLLAVPVLERVDGRAPLEHGLRELAVVKTDVAQERLLKILAGAEAVALQDVLDPTVEPLHHAACLSPSPPRHRALGRSHVPRRNPRPDMASRSSFSTTTLQSARRGAPISCAPATALWKPAMSRLHIPCLSPRQSTWPSSTSCYPMTAQASQFVAKARLSQPDLKVIYVSGYSAERAALDPGTPLLTKPFTRQLLATAVRTSPQTSNVASIQSDGTGEETGRLDRLGDRQQCR